MTSARDPLHPSGAARELFLRGADVEGAHADLGRVVFGWCERAELHASAAFVATDLARLCRTEGRPLSFGRAKAAAALVLILLDAHQRGSTAIDLSTDPLRERACARLRELEVDAPTVLTVKGWLDALSGAPRPEARAAKQLALDLAAEELAPPRLIPLTAPYADDDLSDGKGARTLLVVDGGKLALARWAFAEQAIRAMLANRRAALASPDVIVATLASTPMPRDKPLDAEQLRAVRAGLLGTTTLVTGGPGTGKTSIVVAMLRALVRLPGPSSDHASGIALAAPTGKAADRLREAATATLAGSSDPRDQALAQSLEPKTLHRLLGYQPDRDRFQFHERSRLPARFVVVDEASMLDTMLLFRLLSALDDDAALVLLGDPDQLPSVGPGAVLRDLGVLARHQPSLVSSAHLTKSHRMQESDPAGAHVLGVAQEIAAGRAPERASGPLVPARLHDRTEAPDAEPEGASLFVPSGPRALGQWLDRWFDRLPRPTALRHEPRDADNEAELARSIVLAHASRLLVVTRSAAQRTGQDAVNDYLGHRHAERMGLSPGQGLLSGEPAVVIANDYVRGIFNGDTGLIVQTGQRLALALLARGRVRLLPLDDVGHVVERAWALTVHRAQGSEHDKVALLLPEVDVPRLFTRQIVYTAVTRARRSVEIVGDPALLERAIARVDERTTGLCG